MLTNCPDAILPIMKNNNNAHSWDARTYDKVSSTVQLEWGPKLVEKRRGIGNEIIMDAGAGSGNLTRILAGKVPNEQIYAVDVEPNMIHHAKVNLADCNNVHVIHSSMDDVKLQSKVDVIFSMQLFTGFWINRRFFRVSGTCLNQTASF